MSHHLILELDIVLVDGFIEGPPIFRELCQHSKIFGFWISSKDLLKHVIGALNFSIDKLWINFLIDGLLLFGKLILQLLCSLTMLVVGFLSFVVIDGLIVEVL